MRKLAKARELSGAEWLLLLKVSALFPVVRFSVNRLPFPTVVALFLGKPNLGKPSRDGKQARRHRIRPGRVAYLVEVASRHHFLKPTCLEKALLLSGMLRRSGQEANLQIGTMKSGGKFQAHAWVEHRGEVLLGGPLEHYSPLLPRKPGETSFPAHHSQDGQECPSSLQNQVA